MLAEGTLLQDRYQVERVLGFGGMGTVYLARLVRLGGRPVAIKETRIDIPDASYREQAVRLFEREAQILGRLRHPGLVDVKDFFTEGGSMYLVMDYIEGQTLESMATQAPGPLPLASVLQWMDETCAILEYLHGQTPPILLKDLKPSNIMLEPDGRIRLIDFGIARLLTQQDHTSTNMKGAGTLGFAPPEQYGGQTDERSDVYALGATIYALLAKASPPPSFLLAGGEETLTPLPDLHPEVFAPLQAVVMKMMALRKGERYSSVREARAALRAVAVPAPPVAALPPAARCVRCQQVMEREGRFCEHCGAPRNGVTAPQPSPPPVPAPRPDRPRRAVPVAVWVVAGLVCLVLMGSWASRWNPSPPPARPLPEGMSVYNDAAEGYSVAYPSNWQTYDREGCRRLGLPSSARFLALSPLQDMKIGIDVVEDASDVIQFISAVTTLYDAVDARPHFDLDGSSTMAGRRVDAYSLTGYWEGTRFNGTAFITSERNRPGSIAVNVTHLKAGYVPRELIDAVLLGTNLWAADVKSSK